MKKVINNKKSKNKNLNFLTIKEIREIIFNIKDARDNLIFRILYETGCLPSELINIKVKDILGNKIRIKTRFVLISGKLAKDISLFIIGNKLSNENFLFSTRQSKKISEKRISQIIEFYTKKNIKINAQKIRYYHIIHAYLNGVFLKEIAKNLGLTEFRIFQILQNFDINTYNNYQNFLKKVCL
ncbi:MAG: site-specific integrase [Candidatus Woesearchaeota archaeon]